MAERVRLDPLVPVAADVRDVALPRGRDDEAELPGSARIAQRDRGSERNAVCIRATAPGHAVVQADDRHVGAGDRHAVVEARDEHECVLRAVLDRDPEIGDLDDGGNRFGVAVAERSCALNRRTRLNSTPHEPGGG